MRKEELTRQKLLTALRSAFIPRSTREALLADGRTANWIYDFRPVLLKGDALDLICDALWEKLAPELPFQIGGLETAAIALVGGMLMKAREHGVALSGFYARKSRRKDGLQKQIEGNLTDEKIILVDDALNSARSFMRQIQALEAEGKKAYAVCCIVRYRDEDFYAYFKERGLRIISLFTLDDFPESGGMQKHREQFPAAPPQPRFKALWKFESPNPSYFHILPKSAPALDSERVYFGADNGAMWALNQGDGSVAWKYQTLFRPGRKQIISSPAVYDGIVYFGAYDGNFYALEAKSGKKKWVYWEADWVGSSPCVAPDLGVVFVGLEFGLWNKQGGLAALDLKTGAQKWLQNISTMVHSSPAYSRKFNTVIVGSTGGAVYALDARRGVVKWTYETGGAVRAGFAVDEARGYVCFGSEDKNVYVLDIRSGALARKMETLEPIYSTPLAHEGRLYFGALDKRMLCIDLSTGKTLWTHWTHSRVFSTPSLIDGSLFYGSNDGRLYELDAKTGEELSYFQTTERIVNKIAYNPETKRFFVPTYANEIYCLSRK